MEPTSPIRVTVNYGSKGDYVATFALGEDRPLAPYGEVRPCILAQRPTSSFYGSKDWELLTPDLEDAAHTELYLSLREILESYEEAAGIRRLATGEVVIPA